MPFETSPSARSVTWHHGKPSVQGYARLPPAASLACGDSLEDLGSLDSSDCTTAVGRRRAVAVGLDKTAGVQCPSPSGPSGVSLACRWSQWDFLGPLVLYLLFCRQKCPCADASRKRRLGKGAQAKGRRGETGPCDSESEISDRRSCSKLQVC